VDRLVFGPPGVLLPRSLGYPVRVIDIALLVVAVGAILVGSFAVVASLEFDRLSITVLGYLILCLSVAVAEGLVAGVLLRQLDAYGLTALSVGVALVELFVIRKRNKRVLAAALTIARGLIDGSRRAISSPAVLVLVVIVLAEYSWQALEVLRLPIVSYDSLSYHLIGPATWLQHHAIVQSDQSIFADTYPADQGVLVASLGAFAHTLKYSPFINFVFVLVGGCTGYVLSRLLGARVRYAAIAALAFMSLPPIFLESSTAYVDIAAGVTIVAALVFVVYVWHGKMDSNGRAPGMLGYLFISGCALGLGVGVKSDNLVIIAPVAIAAITQYLRGTTDGQGPRLRIAAPLLALPVVFLGAFWYIRTWITWKNPFYPIDLLGFHGYGTVQQLIIGNNVPPNIKAAPLGYLGQVAVSWLTDLQHHPYYYDSRPGGFGLQWLFILAPGLIYFFVYTFRRQWEWFWFLGLPIVAVLVLTQEPWMARYSMASFILAVAGFALILEKLQKSNMAVLRYANWAVITSFLGLVLVTAVWANTPTAYTADDVGGYPTYLTFSQLAKVVFRGDGATVIQPWPQYHPMQTLPVGSVIGFSGLDSPMYTYPLVGPRFRRQLVRISYSGNNAQRLDAALKAANARYLIIGDAASDRILFDQVEADLTQFKPLSQGDVIGGQDLYQLGTWKACEHTRFSLIAAERSGHRLTVEAKLVSSCGPERLRPVSLLASGINSPLYSGHDRVIVRNNTNAVGIVKFVIPSASPDERYFLRQPGGYSKETLYAPAATAPFTYAFIPLSSP